MKMILHKSDGTRAEIEIVLSTPKNIFTNEAISGEANQEWEANVAISKESPPIKLPPAGKL